MSKIFAGVTAALVLALVTLAVYAKHEATKNAALEASVAGYEQAVKAGTRARTALEDEIDNRDRVLAQVQRRNAAITGELRTVETELQRTYRAEPAALAWHDGTMPDSVFNLVRPDADDPGPGGDEAAAAPGTGRTDTRADPQRKPKRRLADLGATAARGAASG